MQRVRYMVYRLYNQEYHIQNLLAYLFLVKSSKRITKIKTRKIASIFAFPEDYKKDDNQHIPCRHSYENLPVIARDFHKFVPSTQILKRMNKILKNELSVLGVIYCTSPPCTCSI